MRDLAELTIRLGERDNVLTALTNIKAGNYLREGEVMAILEEIPRGFKVAAMTIKKGDKVYKYSHPIGTASHNIKAGSLVHVHNLVSTVRGKDSGGNPDKPGVKQNG